MAQQGPSRGNPIQDYITVAERIEKFYERYPEGRIITHIIEHDAERGFILLRAEIYRNADDALPASTGHAYELKSEGYVQRTSYIEVGETSAVGRALAMAGFEVRRGIASREEMEKAAKMTRETNVTREQAKAPAPPAAAQPASSPPEKAAKPDQPATDEQKQEILGLLESLQPGDRRAQRRVLVEMTGKDSRDDLTQQEASKLIAKLRREVSEGSI
ncbi:MAG: hypothetical protein ACLGJB_22155 [Blastocatellia bacterium]